MNRNPTVLISRSPDASPEARRLEDDLAHLAAAAGAGVLVVPDLYHIAHDEPLRAEIAGLDGRVAVAAWHYPRPAEWVLRAHGLEAAEVLAMDLRECATAEDCWASLADWLAPGAGEGSVREVEGRLGRRWYPVLDYSRCITCRHCLQFCIFGVWGEAGGRVVAVAPDNCKDGCPACARICPRGAIMFPTSDEPAIAGAPGTVLEPDPEARCMYYLRTGTPCPVCGSTADPDELVVIEGAATCEECGRPLDGPAPSAVHDEIDALIDELDALAGEEGR